MAAFLVKLGRLTVLSESFILQVALFLVLFFIRSFAVI